MGVGIEWPTAEGGPLTRYDMRPPAAGHPHLVHEFVRSVVEERPSRIDTDTAAAWTAPGIVPTNRRCAAE